jgi:c-di-GMP-binding flagellar brake protein YcgR
MERHFPPYERRKYPRFPVDFPVDYRSADENRAFVGKAVNASEGGLMVCLEESMKTGTKLVLSMLFNLGYELTEIKARCQVIWKDVGLISDFPGYQYGLKFLEIDEYDISKLKRLRKNTADQLV